MQASWALTELSHATNAFKSFAGSNGFRPARFGASSNVIMRPKASDVADQKPLAEIPNVGGKITYLT